MSKSEKWFYIPLQANAILQSTRTESCPTPLALIVDHHVINNVLKDLQCRERELLSEVPLLVHEKRREKNVLTLCSPVPISVIKAFIYFLLYCPG